MGFTAEPCSARSARRRLNSPFLPF